METHRKKYRTTLVAWVRRAAIALALVAVVSPIASFGASDTKPSLQASAASTGAVSNAFETVNAQVDAVQSVLAAAGIENSSALSIAYDPNVLTIRTKTLVANWLKSIIDTAAGSLLSVRWTVPTFDISELNAEAARVAGLPSVVSAGPNSDYSGLDVGVKDPETFDATSLSKYPVMLHADNEVAASASRDNDTPPPYGAALIISESNGSACTSGLAVMVRTTPAVTTANHCGTGDFMSWGGTTLGHVFTGNGPHDIEALSTSRALGLAWLGPWNSTNASVTTAVHDPVDHMTLCTDGAVSSTHCSGVSVSGINEYVSVDGGTRGPGFFVWNNSVVNVGGFPFQDCAAMQGDSGGPVYTIGATGNMTVRGFMISIDVAFETMECTGHNPNFFSAPNSVLVDSTKTSSRMFVVNAVAALNSIGATLAAQ